MPILELIKDKLKLDLTSVIIETDASMGSSNPFDISARDFLRFAKLDFKSGNDKGNINALTNAKRAIDCQIDTALAIYGIKFDKINSSSNRIIELSNLNKLDLPHKFKLIQALDFAPSGLIARTRTLRNKLEHYYKLPNAQEVLEAIELAELLILAIERNIKFILCAFFITDSHNFLSAWQYNNFIRVAFDDPTKEFQLTFFQNNQKVNSITYNQHDMEHYALLKLCNNIDDEPDLEDAMIVFLKMINHPIPSEHVNLTLLN